MAWGSKKKDTKKSSKDAKKASKGGKKASKGGKKAAKGGKKGGKKGAKGGKKGKRPDRKTQLKKLNKAKVGEFTNEECLEEKSKMMRKCRWAFLTVDEDDSHELTQDEFLAACSLMLGEEELDEDTTEAMTELYTSMDTDGNGTVDLQEFTVAWSAKIKADAGGSEEGSEEESEEEGSGSEEEESEEEESEEEESEESES